MDCFSVASGLAAALASVGQLPAVAARTVNLLPV
jgi:hypothetical protein